MIDIMSDKDKLAYEIYKLNKLQRQRYYIEKQILFSANRIRFLKSLKGA